MYLNNQNIYMKKKMNLSKTYYWILPVLALFSIASCKKENSTGFTPGTGAPVITAVRTLNSSIVDSSRTTSVTTYSSSGVVSTTTNPNYNPVLTALDSTTVTGKLGNYYVLEGSNLGSTTKIAINGVSIYFNRALNSDSHVIFSIPTTVPYIQPQPNTIVVTTTSGTVTYKFTTLPPPPTIMGVSDFDFTAGSQITLIGKGFANVTAIKLKTTGDAATIVSQSDSTLVMQMPKSTITESSLLFTYNSGSKTGLQGGTATVFNDLDNAYQVFVNNNFQNGWFNNSWAAPSGVSTDASHSGTSSAKATYPANGWQIEGWADWNTPGKFAYDPTYKYFSFWVKGGTVAHTLVLVGDQMVGGYGQVSPGYAAQQIVVPANVWTFFKIPLGPPSSTSTSLLNFWAKGTPAQQIGFFLKGQNTDVNETMYFDEVALLK
ncbi:MAG: hypothetical protein JWP45_807 [Mucilaginibacter sp.]|nr:hypothetical protein [Mucilaginibacter sp.]